MKFCRWVGYCYRPGGEKPPRYRGDFFADKRLPAGQRAEPADYQGLYKRDLSGFDRGHQAPDATIKVLGEEAQRETYALSNITPQYSKLNQGFWREMEDAIRGWATSEEPVCVVTGPVFEEGRDIERVGENLVAVPHGYYAVVVQGAEPEVLAFLVQNKPERRGWDEAATFLTSVDEVEKLTGFDFMAGLPDQQEAQIEAGAAGATWDR